MQNNVVYRDMRADERDRVFDLVRAGFDAYVLPDVTQEGSQEFFRAAREMVYSGPAGHFILVAESAGTIAGMIDVRDRCHICLFFVAGEFQQRGIGSELLRQAMTICISEDAAVSEIEVNASLYAVPFYKSMGFREMMPEQMKNGIRFVPMVGPLRNR